MREAVNHILIEYWYVQEFPGASFTLRQVALMPDRTRGLSNKSMATQGNILTQDLTHWIGTLVLVHSPEAGSGNINE